MTTNFERYSAGGKTEIVPNTIKEATTLPAKTHWKAASGKEATSLKNNNIYTVLPATTNPTDHKIFDSRWIHKFKADKSLYSDGDKYQAPISEALSLWSAAFRVSVLCWR